MVTTYTGTPGSGKSLHCARAIMRMLSSGCRVISNFPINLNMIKKRYRNNFFYIPDEYLTAHYLLEFAKAYHKSKGEDQTFIFIDEAQRIFPIDRVYPDRKAWEQFFQLHRHMGFSIVLVTQNMGYINKGIRIQSEYEIKHRKVNNYGVGGLILTFLHIPLFASITYWQGTKEKVSSEFFLYKKKYGDLYDTFSNFDTVFGSQSQFEPVGASAEDPSGDLEIDSGGVKDPEELDEFWQEDLDIDSVDFDEENRGAWSSDVNITDEELKEWIA